MYVSIMAFNAKVSDPLIGGTYMTLLNTVSNLGGNWPSTVALWLVDPLTVKECVGASNQNCGTPDAVEVSVVILDNMKLTLSFCLQQYCIFLKSPEGYSALISERLAHLNALVRKGGPLSFPYFEDHCLTRLALKTGPVNS